MFIFRQLNNKNKNRTKIQLEVDLVKTSRLLDLISISRWYYPVTVGIFGFFSRILSGAVVTWPRASEPSTMVQIQSHCQQLRCLIDKGHIKCKTRNNSSSRIVTGNTAAYSSTVASRTPSVLLEPVGSDAGRRFKCLYSTIMFTFSAYY